jgi:hypothetical protein
MKPDLLDAVAKIDETAFAEHLRLLDHTVDVNRRRLEKQDEELLRLQAQVRSIDETFKKIRIRTAAPAVPVMPAHRAPVPQTVPAPMLPSAARRRLWPYAVLAAVALALAPSVSFQTGTPVSAEAAIPKPTAVPDRSAEAIGLALSFRPDGAERTFADLLGPELDFAGPSAWQAQSVGDGVYLVSFSPHDIRGPQAEYEFTVDVNARSVIPEAETAERLNSGASSVADR